MAKQEIDRLGEIIKSARTERHISRKELAREFGISVRYLVAIENENRKPSYELLFHIIRKLHIPADTIFYPELGYDHSELEKLRLLLSQCDEKEVCALIAALQRLLEHK